MAPGDDKRRAGRGRAVDGEAMRLKKADRQLLMLLGIALCLALVWWAVSRGGSSPGALPDGAGSATSSATGGSKSTVSPSGSAGSPSGSAGGSSGGSAGTTPSASAATPVSGLPTIRESELPREGRTTLALIRSGGPFPYRADDGVFTNRERILPRRANGYYREYTVITPGSPDRGARRIIGGAEGDRYYTADHYDSFRQIEERQ